VDFGRVAEEYRRQKFYAANCAGRTEETRGPRAGKFWQLSGAPPPRQARLCQENYATPFATDGLALMAELQSETYRAAAKDWEGDFYFVVNAGSVPQDIYLYMDLWHGACRAAHAVADPAAQSPEFVIEASLPTWRKVIEKKLDPIQGMIMRQLKLTGPMLKVVRAPKAATGWPVAPHRDRMAQRERRITMWYFNSLQVVFGEDALSHLRLWAGRS
jgi:putative sterol carrier protein